MEGGDEDEGLSLILSAAGPPGGASVGLRDVEVEMDADWAGGRLVGGRLSEVVPTMTTWSSDDSSCIRRLTAAVARGGEGSSSSDANMALAKDRDASARAASSAGSIGADSAAGAGRVVDEDSRAAGRSGVSSSSE